MTRATLRYDQSSPTKVRQVLDLVRGLDVAEAREILRFSQRGASEEVAKLLDSAIANAEHNDHIASDELFVSAAWANEGPTAKRFRPRARGRGTRIRKRTSHVTIVLSRFSDDELDRRRRREEATGPTRRLRRPTRRRRVREVEEDLEDEELIHEDAEEFGETGELEDEGEDVALADVPDVDDVDAKPLGAGEDAPAKKAPAKKKAPATKKPTKKATTAKKTTAKKAQKPTKKTTKKKKDD